MSELLHLLESMQVSKFVVHTGMGQGHFSHVVFCGDGHGVLQQEGSHNLAQEAVRNLQTCQRLLDSEVSVLAHYSGNVQ